MKQNRIRMFVTLVFVVTCGYLLSGCLANTSGGGSGLPSPNKAGTATNKVPGK